MFLDRYSVTKSDPTLRPHGLQHIRLLWPSLCPRVCSNSCPLSQWCHPSISSSVTSSTCPQSSQWQLRDQGPLRALVWQKLYYCEKEHRHQKGDGECPPSLVLARELYTFSVGYYSKSRLSQGCKGLIRPTLTTYILRWQGFRTEFKEKHVLHQGELFCCVIINSALKEKKILCDLDEGMQK